MIRKIRLISQRGRRFFNKFLLNGAFIAEILLLLLTRSSIQAMLAKIDTSKFNEKLLIIFFIELIFIIIFLSFSEKVSIVLKRLQYLLLIEVISYYIVYTIALIVISSGIGWNINTFGIFMLSWVLYLIVILYSTKFTKHSEVTVALLTIGHLCLVLLFSLAWAIDIHNFYHYDPIYLICSLTILVLLTVAFYLFKKKININKYFGNLIQHQVVDMIVSFLFVVLFIIFVAALILEYRSSLKDVFNEWVPLLALAISIGIVLWIYFKHIKKLVTEPFVIYYFMFWAIVPIVLFGLYFQKENLGNYTTFKGLLAIILAIDAFVLLAFGKDMKVLLPKFENNLTEKPGATYAIAKLKLILSNITILVTFLNTISSKEEILTIWVDNTSNIFYKISILMNKYFKNNNFEVVFSNNLFKDEKFKIILFMFGLVSVLLFLSWLFFKIEKWIFVKMSFRKL